MIRRAIIVALVAAACSQPQQPAPRRVVDASVEQIRVTPIPDVRITTGSVRATTVATLSAKLLGNVTRVLVSEGDRVHAGQLLLEIESRDVRARVDQARAAVRAANAAIAAAEANAKFADATLERYALLRERGLISSQDFDEVEAKEKAAQAEADRTRRGHAQAIAAATEAETVLSYTEVRSPIDGVVSARLVDAGAQAAPGVPLIAVEDGQQYRVETTIDEELAGRVHAGDFVEVNGLPARIAHVAPVESLTRSALVKIDLPSTAGLRSGTFVRVGFPVGTRNAITVPSSAIVRNGEMTSVFVVDTGFVARMRLVTTSEPKNGRLEILSGIDSGERIVANASSVTDGVRVRS